MSAAPSLENPSRAGARIRPVTFGPPEDRLFGWFHPPTGPTQRACGVVLCYPFGVEQLRVYRAYRVLSQQLAAAGFPVLRFDYHGTGNSVGSDVEPARLAAWRSSIDAAIEALKDLSGVAQVSLFGVRLGASLAWLAAGERDDVDSLVLWSPVQRGRAYARELKALSAVQEGAPPPTAGFMESGGFVFSDETVASLSAVDLLKAELPRVKAALLFSRDDFPPELALVERLRTAGLATDFVELPGYAALMRDPHDAQVPAAVWQRLIDWLTERYALAAAASAPSSEVPPTLEHRADFRERALQLGPQGELFGVLTEPRAGPRAGAPLAILLNVGSNHHIGPNRMWVLLARRLAAVGFTSLRFDVAGLGDSPAPPDGKENRLYSQDSVRDVQQVMDGLQVARGTKRFVVIGLCSGAYLAFYSALRDQRIAGQVLINPQTFHWKEGDSLELAMRSSYKSTDFYKQRLLDPRIWKRILRGEVNLRGIAGSVAKRLGQRAWDRLRPLVAPQRKAEGIDVGAAFRELSGRGTQSLLVYSAEDGGLDEIQRHLGPRGRNMRRKANFGFELIQGADHTFTPMVTREELFQIIERHMVSRFG